MTLEGGTDSTDTISGTYMAKGVFDGRIIYEKTVADGGYWWSFRYKSSSNQWDFWPSKIQVTIGQTMFGEIIEDCSNKQC